MNVPSDINLATINTEKVNGKTLVKVLQSWYRGHSQAINNLSNSLTNLPVYASNAAAVAAGLRPGQFYRNGENVCVVH